MFEGIKIYNSSYIMVRLKEHKAAQTVCFLLKKLYEGTKNKHIMVTNIIVEFQTKR